MPPRSNQERIDDLTMRIEVRMEAVSLYVLEHVRGLTITWVAHRTQTLV